jgi:hypothetical protein
MINQSLLVAEKPLKVRIASITGAQVKLLFSDRQFVEINKKYLPVNSQVGDELYLNLLNEEGFQMTKKEIAKHLLENLLGTDES